MSRNKSENLSATEVPKGGEGRLSYAMTPEEVRALIETALLDLDDLVFVFALYTGLRPEEYLGLDRQHLELGGERGLVRVRRAVVKLRGGGWEFPPPKTKQGARDVPLPAWLCQKLKQHELFIDSRRRAMGEGWTDYGLVFPSCTGEPLRRDGLRDRRFKSLLKRAGLAQHFTLYSLRYTFATLQYLAGERDRVISDLMGHTRTDFTKEVYTKVLPQMREQASDSLERLLFGAVRPALAQSGDERVM